MIFYKIDIKLCYGDNVVLCETNKKTVVEKALTYINTLSDEDKQGTLCFERMDISIDAGSIKQLLIGTEFASNYNLLFLDDMSKFVEIVS